MKEGDIIFGNDVVFDNDKGNDTHDDNVQFTLVSVDALCLWPSERSSIAIVVYMDIAAVGKCHFSTRSAVHLMNTMIMTLVLNTLFDPTMRLVMMHFHWWVLLKRVAVASIPAVKEGGEGDDGSLRSWVVDSNFCPFINHTWPRVTHQGFYFFPGPALYSLSLLTYIVTFLELEPIQLIMAVF